MYKCRISHLQSVTQHSELTTLNVIPALQRRRLSFLAKLALHAAKSTLVDLGQLVDYIVWCSRCGDEKKTVDILLDIANQQMPSPTQFSTSVHNAVAGLYSILFQDATPSTSLSSAATTAWQDSVFEAYAWLKSNQKSHALVIYYDEPLPEIYQDDLAVTETVAIAAIISLSEPNFSIQSVNRQVIDSTQQALQFVEFYTADQVVWQSNHWIWQKC